MFCIAVKLPYFPQLRRSEPALASSLRELLETASKDFGARMLPGDRGFLLSFDEAKGCARLRAAECLRRLEESFAGIEGRLHGWTLALEAGEGPLDSLALELERLWFGMEADGSYVGPGARVRFEGYLELSEGRPSRVRGFPYARPVLPEGFVAPRPERSALERLAEELRSLLAGNSEARLLIATGPEAPALLASVVKEPEFRGLTLLRFHAGAEDSPFGPFLAGLPAPSQEALAALDGTERAAFLELASVAAFLRASPFRRGFSDTLRARFRLLVEQTLALQAREAAARGSRLLVLLEGLDDFPEESLELAERLPENAGGASGPHFLATSSRRPSFREGEGVRLVAAPPPAPSAIAEAARAGALALNRPEEAPGLARLARGESFRLGLGLRLVLAGRKLDGSLTPEALCRAVLETLPEEFGEYLSVLARAEGLLGPEDLAVYLADAGFFPGLRPLLDSMLSRLGLLSGKGEGSPERILAAVADREERRRILAAASSRQEALERTFAERLLSLHAAKQLIPSLALYRRLYPGPGLAAEGRRRTIFFLDCLAADALYGSSAGLASSVGDEGPLALLTPFLEAYAAGDAPKAAAARASLEAAVAATGNPPLETALAALVGASDDYARGAPAKAAAALRPALIGLHDAGALRAEARALRVFGLCSLGLGQVPEGAEYLANALELAERVPDLLESFHAAFSSAGAFLVLGEYRHAELRALRAQEQARKAFRPEWEAAGDFLLGRIAFELGRYPEAESRFSRVAASTAGNGLPGEGPGRADPRLSQRARIWAGRAAAFASAGYRETGSGETVQSHAPERAQRILESAGEDAEARWFLAEIAAWEGDWSRAAEQAEAALRLAPRTSYAAADALSWDSGYAVAEGRALGFWGERSYLEDQVGALADLARGMLGATASAKASLAERGRERKLASVHPQTHLYYYYSFLISEREHPGSLDASSMLSRAWKALQLRTARMEEAAYKDDFLERNRWNRELLRSAKAAKLL